MNIPKLGELVDKELLTDEFIEYRETILEKDPSAVFCGCCGKEAEGEWVWHSYGTFLWVSKCCGYNLFKDARMRQVEVGYE